MGGTLCEHCTGACCRYVALPIETPESAEDYDDIRWYLLHENVSVFVEDGEWFINFATPCRHLQPDNRCGIYARRPRICRNYSEDNCDYHSGDYGWEQHFTCAEHLDAYLRTRSEPPGKKRSTSKKEKKNLKKEEGKRNKKGSKTKKIKGKRTLGRLRPRPSADRRLAAAPRDTAGIPLPILDGAP